jgi:PEP-CTERM motif
MTYRRIRTQVLGCLVGVALATGLSISHAAPTYVFGNTISLIPGLTGFATNGAMMDGMGVIVTGSNNSVAFTETRFWADTGATSGGVTGTGWSLSEIGDTFTGPWSFNLSQGVVVNSFKLTGNAISNGVEARTVFDVDMFGGNPCTYSGAGSDIECTPGSARGARMVFTQNLSPVITYSEQVGITPNQPLGDLFHKVSVDFGEAGMGANFVFTQDTDNDSRFNIPEPGSLALLGLSLAGLGFIRRKHRQAVFSLQFMRTQVCCAIQARVAIEVQRSVIGQHPGIHGG